MSSFTNTIVGVGPICDADCTVLFTKHNLTVFSPEGKLILTGWREKDMPKLWRFALRPIKEHLPNQAQESKQTTIAAYIAYDIPSVKALVWYMHTSSGFLVNLTWLR